MNSITDTIVKDIIKEQTMNGGLIGSKIHVSGTSTFVVLMKRVTLMQLKNWRKQFLSIILKQQINQDQVAASFVTFINTQLKESIVCSKDVREKEFTPQNNNRSFEISKKEKYSEAGNRTPVVRVTGGNTKPLYYFGTILPPKLRYLRSSHSDFSLA